MGEHRMLSRVESLYDEIYKLIWAMVWDICTPDRWQLDADEIFGDLSLELVKVCKAYPDKEGRELKALVIKSLHNRVKDLMVICYKTHRKAESSILSMDDIMNVPGTEMSVFDMEELFDNISSDAQRLVGEILWPSERTCWTMDLFVQRKVAISKNGGWKLKITPLLMERALGWSSGRLQNAWEEVSSILSV